MGTTTNISWCDSTWNWAWNCDRVSPACAHCYIESAVPLRRAGLKLGGPIIVAKDVTFNAPLKWSKNPWVCDECGHVHTELWVQGCENTGDSLTTCQGCNNRVSMHRRRVFTLSLGDFFNRRNPIGSLTRALHIIWQCQDLDFLICTKRPELFKELLYAVLGLITDGTGSNADFWQWLLNWVGGKAPANVWIGTTVEDQKRADERIPALLKIPARVRFLSCEPLLEDINLGIGWTQDGFTHPHGMGGARMERKAIDWVIVGGESGPHSRPCNVDWIHSIVSQCRSAGVPVFVKQVGSNPVHESMSTIHMRPDHPKGGDPAEWPEDLRVQEFPEVR